MPVTAVGKIFKPELRHRAIREVFLSELEALSELVESIDVAVSEDKAHGTTAYITAAPAAGVSEARIRERLDAILGHYTAPTAQIEVGAWMRSRHPAPSVVADEEATRRVLDAGG
jgi:hypothetical protein